MPECGGLFVRLHCRVQHLHVRFRRHQIVFAVPVRCGEIFRLCSRGPVHHSDQCHNRERGRHLGARWQEAQILRGAKGRPGACYGLMREFARLFKLYRFKIFGRDIFPLDDGC